MATKLPPPSLAQVEDFLRLLHTGMGKDKPSILLKSREENRQGLLDLKIKDVFDCIPYITGLTPAHASQF